MSKETKIIEWLNHGCYPGFTMFIQNHTIEEVIKYCKKIKAKEWLPALDEYLYRPSWGQCSHVEVENEDGVVVKNLYFIILHKGFDLECGDDYIKLAHEVVHLCQFFLPGVLDRNKEIEAEAYFHTHIMNQIIDLVTNVKSKSAH